MKKMKSIIFLFVSCVLILFTNFTYGKYTSDIYGVAWFPNFTDFQIIGEIFVVETEDLKTDGTGNIKAESDKLWGAEADDGTMSKPSTDEFNMGNLGNVQYTVKNNSNDRLLIMFKLKYTAPEIGSNGLTGGGILYEVSNVTYPKPDGVSNIFGSKVLGEIVAPSSSSLNDNVADIYATQGAQVYSGGIFNRIKYYLHECTIDPRIYIDGSYSFGTGSFNWGTLNFNADTDLGTVTKAFIEENFVLEPGESGNFNIHTIYQGFLNSSNSIDSAYASVKLVAVPYNG